MDYAAVAGMSDEKIKAKTGCTWERWVYALDRRGAEKMPHRDIVALVNWSDRLDALGDVLSARGNGASTT